MPINPVYFGSMNDALISSFVRDILLGIVKSFLRPFVSAFAVGARSPRLSSNSSIGRLWGDAASLLARSSTLDSETVASGSGERPAARIS